MTATESIAKPNGLDQEAETRVEGFAPFGASNVTERLVNRGVESPDSRTVQLVSGAGDTGPDYRLVRANVDGPFEPPQWLWEARIPIGELTIIAARGEVGKTTLVLDLAAQLSRGELPGYMLGRNGKVMFFTDEASFERVITPRYAAAGGVPDSLFTVEFVETGDSTDGFVPRPMSLAKGGDMRILAGLIEKEGIDLLILDPVDMLLGGIDAHRNNEVRSALSRIMSSGCTVIGIQHLTKSSNVANAGDRVMGSAAYRNLPRSVLVADYDRADRELVVLAHDKSNYGPRQPSLSFKTVDSHIKGFARVQWLDEVAVTADDLLTSRSRKPSLVEQCRVWLGDLVAENGAMAPQEVLRLAEEEGYGRTTVYNARKDIGVTTDAEARWTL